MKTLKIGDRATVEFIQTEVWHSPSKCIHAIVTGITEGKYSNSVHIHSDELTEQKHHNGIYSGHYNTSAYLITKEE